MTDQVGCREPFQPSRFCGTLLTEAPARIDQAACAECIAAGVALPPLGEFITGAIIGLVEITGCILDSPSLWAIPGYWRWLTAPPRAADPVIPLKGQLSMFDPPDGREASFHPSG